MKYNILVLGRHAGMMQNVIAFLNNNGFENVTGILTNEETIHALQRGSFTHIIIGGGVDAETRKIIKELVAQNNIAIKIVEHFGSLATLVDEIKN